jgi:hypothetical protein
MPSSDQQRASPTTPIPQEASVLGTFQPARKLAQHRELPRRDIKAASCLLVAPPSSGLPTAVGRAPAKGPAQHRASRMVANAC